jgi:hypothetical protein
MWYHLLLETVWQYGSSNWAVRMSTEPLVCLWSCWNESTATYLTVFTCKSLLSLFSSLFPTQILTVQWPGLCPDCLAIWTCLQSRPLTCQSTISHSKYLGKTQVTHPDTCTMASRDHTLQALSSLVQSTGWPNRRHCWQRGKGSGICTRQFRALIANGSIFSSIGGKFVRNS